MRLGKEFFQWKRMYILLRVILHTFLSISVSVLPLLKWQRCLFFNMGIGKIVSVLNRALKRAAAVRERGVEKDVDRDRESCFVNCSILTTWLPPIKALFTEFQCQLLCSCCKELIIIMLAHRQRSTSSMSVSLCALPCVGDSPSLCIFPLGSIHSDMFTVQCISFFQPQFPVKCQLPPSYR